MFYFRPSPPHSLRIVVYVKANRPWGKSHRYIGKIRHHNRVNHLHCIAFFTIFAVRIVAQGY